MTYCLAIKLNEGLVFCSDSRTNAGPDRVSTYSKLHRFSLQNDRQIALLSAGNLATTQAVISQVERDLQSDTPTSLHKAEYISDIADYIGELSVKTQDKYAPAGPNAGFDAEASFIVGGQIKGNEPELYMVYPEGNHITASDQFPFLQIGETKYGKPILDRIVRKETSHETAMRCALVSMDSTMSSNATVGPPIELLFLENNLFTESYYQKFDENDDYLITLRAAWDQNLTTAFNDLPTLDNESQPNSE